MNKFWFHLVILVLGFAFPALGQNVQEEKISGIFSGLSFDRFARQIEDRYSYKFFFKSADVDSLTFNISATGNPLDNILSGIFAGSELTFSIDSQKQVFITKGQSIRV